MINWQNSSNFLIDENAIHIWLIDVAQQQPHLDDLFQALSTEEQTSANRFKFSQDAHSFIASHAILRLLLSRYLAIQPQHISFQQNQYGKPFLTQKTEIEFNLSHTKNYALIAINKNEPVGIDIEYTKRNKMGYLDLAKRFFSAYEHTTLQSLPKAQQTLGFYHAWTRKEAFIKAIGQGIAFNLNQFDVTLAPQTPTQLLAIQGSTEKAQHWQLESFYPVEDYCGAIAWKGKPKTLKFYQWYDTSR